jgi:hypothetical protein
MFTFPVFRRTKIGPRPLSHRSAAWHTGGNACVARAREKPFESTAEIIPGDRGKVDGNWCRQPLRNPAQATPPGKYHQFLWPESCPVSIHEPGTVRRGAIRNRIQAESGPQRVSICAPTQLPQRVWLLLRRPERRCVSRRAHPAKRPRSLARAGRAREAQLRGVSEPGKARQPPR